MKTISKFLAMFMFAVSAFCYVSCSEDDGNGNSVSGNITIDGVSYEYEGGISESDWDNHIWIEIDATYRNSLSLLIRNNKISNLKVGDVFDNDLYVNRYRGSQGCEYVSGSVFIADINIKKASLKMRIDNLTFVDYDGCQHVINGTVVLYHSVYDENGNRLPFPTN